MSWVRIDDKFTGHAKFSKLGPELGDAALALWIRALAYCNCHETDGYVPVGMLRSLSLHRKPTVVADRLVEVGLWEIREEGYAFHDYAKYQPTREAKAARRGMKSEAGRAGGIRSAQARAKQTDSSIQADCLTSAEQNSSNTQAPPTRARAPAPGPGSGMGLEDGGARGGAPDPTEPNAAAVLTLLRSHQALRGIARAELAERYATHVVHGGKRLVDVLASIRKAGDSEADAIAGGNLPRDSRTLTSWVGGFVNRTRRGEADEPKPTPARSPARERRLQSAEGVNETLIPSEVRDPNVPAA